MRLPNTGVELADAASLDLLSTTRREQVEELVESLGLIPPAHPGIGAV